MSNSSQSTKSMMKIVILLIEDNLPDIQNIQQYLKESKGQLYKIIQAKSLQSAFNLMCHHEIDIALLDLYLPDSAGLETLRKFIAEVPDKPIIVLSEMKSEKVAFQAVRYGAQDYLEKDQLSLEILKRSIRYSIERMNSLMDKSDLLNDLNMALQHIEMQESLLKTLSWMQKDTRKRRQVAHTWGLCPFIARRQVRMPYLPQL